MDQALDQLVGGAPVELEPAQAVAHRLGADLHRHRRLVGEDHRHALGRGGAGRRRVGVAVRHLEHADGGEHQRAGDAPPEQLDARVPAGDVAQHARHDPPALERVGVRALGGLVAGSGRDVRERLRGHRALGGLLELVDLDRDARAAPADATEVDRRYALGAAHGRRYYHAGR